MNQQLQDPASQGNAKLTIRNWLKNGAACTAAVVFGCLIILNLLLPWQADVRGANYSESETVGSTKTTRWYKGVDAKGEGNAFSSSAGWATLILMLGTLWVCATPRHHWGGFRWFPMISGSVSAWMVFLGLRELQREWDAFNATLTTKAIVTYPPAMQWVFIFSILLAFVGAFLARAPKSVDGRAIVNQQ